MKDTLRTFIAVELDPAIRTRAERLIATLGAAGADVKWVETHNLHLTMKFLGDVPSRDVSAICRAVERAAEQVEPFVLEIHGAGAFPNADRPRTVWLGAGSGEEQMAVLHQQIEAGLAELGFRKEHRRFHSHLTIGRVRSGGAALAKLSGLLWQHAQFEGGLLEVSKVTVFSSQLTPSGSIYEALSRAELGQRSRGTL